MVEYGSSGTKYVSYSYDAWGNFTVNYHNGGGSTSVTKNPLTYRGYYYDQDLGLYYLNTRYYDAKVGRFISPDGVMAGASGDLHGFNLYVYCFNNPLMYTDSSGNWPEWVEDVANWFKENIGFGIVQAETYPDMSFKTFFGGSETGKSVSKVIAGDISKPVSLYASNASEWWKLWEYNIGIQVNTEKGGAAFSVGLGEVSVTLSYEGNSTQAFGGINKIGITQSVDVDFGNRTAGMYYHGYVRTIPLAATAIMTYYTKGAVVPLIQGMR